MILRDKGSSSQGTSTDLNLTQPVFVCNGDLSFGVGVFNSSRKGGIKTETIKSPTINPVNVQKRDIITLNKEKNGNYTSSIIVN
jgi:hypothetical protein